MSMDPHHDSWAHRATLPCRSCLSVTCSSQGIVTSRWFSGDDIWCNKIGYGTMHATDPLPRRCRPSRRDVKGGRNQDKAACLVQSAPRPRLVRLGAVRADLARLVRQSEQRATFSNVAAVTVTTASLFRSPPHRVTSPVCSHSVHCRYAAHLGILLGYELSRRNRKSFEFFRNHQPAGGLSGSWTGRPIPYWRKGHSWLRSKGRPCR
jgi:hypothetical protein